MSELKLKLAVTEAEKNAVNCKRRYTALHKELDAAETKLIDAREAHRRALDELNLFQQTRVIDTSVNDERLREIEEYRQRMPEVLKSIEGEKLMPFKTMTDLGVERDDW